jgi:hypothetical protein
MSSGLLLTVLSFAFLQNTTPATPSLSERRDVLRAVIAITTSPAADVSKIPVTMAIEHDSEVARTENVLVVVTIQGCKANAAGTCQATADVIAYKPDNSVHSEMKSISLANNRGTAVLTLAPTDVTGVYRVEATVRDPNAQRVAKTERLFGVK